MLYLIPTPIGDNQPLEVLPLSIKKTVTTLDVFLVENIKTAKSFLANLGIKKQEKLTFHLLNKNSTLEDNLKYIEIMKNGIHLGLLSEAGTPAIADPGSDLIHLAHQNKIRVKPLVGPSSLILSLSASGLNGQNFSFVGYLPIEKSARKRRIKQLENISLKNNQTQIFIETPYRNNSLFDTLIKVCHNNTLLCIASNINCKDELLLTEAIENWKKKQNINLNKKPTTFLIHKY